MPSLHQHERSYSFKFMNVDEAPESPLLIAKTPDGTGEQDTFELIDADEAQKLRWFTSSVLCKLL